MDESNEALTMTKSGRLRGPKGRFVPFQRPATEAQEASEPGGTGPGTAKELLRPAQCAVYLRRELANSFPAIVQGFVKQAESGSVPHFKLTNELLKNGDAPKKQKGSAQRLLEELERMDRDKAAEAESAAEADVWRE